MLSAFTEHVYFKQFSQYGQHGSDSYQYGVPTKEFAGEAMEAEPKSASLTCPGSVSRMFPAFTSLNEEAKENVEEEKNNCYNYNIHYN